MKKRLLVILLVVAMTLGCVGALSACQPKETGFKIGVLHINPVDSTSGYTYAHQQGIEYMQKELGLRDSQIVIQDSIDDQNSEGINKAIESCIAQGCNMIIGTSFGYMEEIQNYANANPQIIFSHGTGYLDTFGDGKNNNMNNYFGRIYQARYLSGIVAGLKASQGANLGYVSAHGTTIAECTSGVNAFALGVQSVNPDAKVKVKTLNSWFSPENESSYAETLLAAPYNCEIIAQHCDTENPPAAAKAANKYSVGYNSDMAKAIGGDSVLTSVVWNWGVYYKAAVEAAMKCFTITKDGDKETVAFKDTEAWKAFGNYYGDYRDGLYGLADLSAACNADTQAILDLVTAEMKKGVEDWDVFTDTALSFEKNADGVWTMKKTPRTLNKADGTPVGEVTVANITGNMPYWIQGVDYLA